MAKIRYFMDYLVFEGNLSLTDTFQIIDNLH